MNAKCTKWLLHILNDSFLGEQLKVSDCKPSQTSLTCSAGVRVHFFSTGKKNLLQFLLDSTDYNSKSKIARLSPLPFLAPLHFNSWATFLSD